MESNVIRIAAHSLSPKTVGLPGATVKSSLPPCAGSEGSLNALVLIAMAGNSWQLLD
jgi:phage protein U